MKKIITKSDRETMELGEEFAKTLKPGDTVFLYGDLGFGKTTFVKGVAYGLGIKTRIISPTFTIIRQHEIRNKQSLQSSASPAGLQESGIVNLYHIDLYRLEKEGQLQEIGMEEILADMNSLKLIEWPEKLENHIPAWSIKIESNTDDTRTINIIKNV